MDEKNLQEWSLEEADDETMGMPAKVVSVGLLVVIGLVALSMIPDEQMVAWQIIYAGVGLGSIAFGVKAARE